MHTELLLTAMSIHVQGFFADFLRIADDESRHFGWCAQRLRELGYEYGCMPAHDLLWQGAQRSSGEWAPCILLLLSSLQSTSRVAKPAPYTRCRESRVVAAMSSLKKVYAHWAAVAGTCAPLHSLHTLIRP